jgi:hypothetical protein
MRIAMTITVWTSDSFQYLRARWYDLSVGRFINEESYEGQIDNPLTLNIYTYVSSSAQALREKMEIPETVADKR